MQLQFLKSGADVWGWAKSLVTSLNKSRTLKLDTLDLTGKAGYTIKVNASETGFELVP